MMVNSQKQYTVFCKFKNEKCASQVSSNFIVVALPYLGLVYSTYKTYVILDLLSNLKRHHLLFAFVQFFTSYY